MNNDKHNQEPMKTQGGKPSAGSTCSAAYLEGRKAYTQNIKVGDNPHDQKTKEHWEWIRGWAEEGIV